MTKSLISVVGLGLAAGLTAGSVHAAAIVVDLGANTNLTMSGTPTAGTGTISYQQYQIGANTPGPIALKDTTGAASGITMDRTAQPATGFLGFNGAGPTTLSGVAATLFPDAIGTSSGFVGPGGTVDLYSAELTFSGLDTTGNTKYTFDLLSARAAAGPRVTNFTVTGSTVGTASIDSAGNASALVHIADILPTGAGTIALKWSNGTGSGIGYGYLNGVQITTAAVPEPASLALVGLGGLAMLGRRRARA